MAHEGLLGFGVLRDRPLRKFLKSPEWKERPLLGFLAENPGEIRAFRRGIASALLTGAFLALYLETVARRLPRT